MSEDDLPPYRNDYGYEVNESIVEVTEATMNMVVAPLEVLLDAAYKMVAGGGGFSRFLHAAHLVLTEVIRRVQPSLDPEASTAEEPWPDNLRACLHRTHRAVCRLQLRNHGNSDMVLATDMVRRDLLTIHVSRPFLPSGAMSSTVAAPGAGPGAEPPHTAES